MPIRGIPTDGPFLFDLGSPYDAESASAAAPGSSTGRAASCSADPSAGFSDSEPEFDPCCRSDTSLHRDREIGMTCDLVAESVEDPSDVSGVLCASLDVSDDGDLDVVAVEDAQSRTFGWDAERIEDVSLSERLGLTARRRKDPAPSRAPPSGSWGPGRTPDPVPTMHSALWASMADDAPGARRELPLGSVLGSQQQDPTSHSLDIAFDENLPSNSRPDSRSTSCAISETSSAACSQGAARPAALGAWSSDDEDVEAFSDEGGAEHVRLPPLEPGESFADRYKVRQRDGGGGGEGSGSGLRWRAGPQQSKSGVGGWCASCRVGCIHGMSIWRRTQKERIRPCPRWPSSSRSPPKQ